MGDKLKLGLQLFPGWKATSKFLTHEFLQSGVPVYLERSYDGKSPLAFEGITSIISFVCFNLCYRQTRRYILETV